MYANEETLIYINRLHYPVTVLGKGKRLGIWFQGCSIKCQGCINQELQEQKAASGFTDDQIHCILARYQKENVDGITITGGEPFDQPKGLRRVIDISRSLCLGEILVYSGYEFDFLRNHFRDLLEGIDILISGPFIESLPTNRIWRGSDNQEIQLLSIKAQNHYPAFINDLEYRKDDRPIQFSLVGDSLFLIGIPRRGDVNSLKELCSQRGVLLR